MVGWRVYILFVFKSGRSEKAAGNNQRIDTELQIYDPELLTENSIKDCILKGNMKSYVKNRGSSTKTMFFIFYLV